MSTLNSTCVFPETLTGWVWECMFSWRLTEAGLDTAFNYDKHSSTHSSQGVPEFECLLRKLDVATLVVHRTRASLQFWTSLQFWSSLLFSSTVFSGLYKFYSHWFLSWRAMEDFDIATTGVSFCVCPMLETEFFFLKLSPIHVSTFYCGMRALLFLRVWGLEMLNWFRNKRITYLTVRNSTCALQFVGTAKLT